MNSIYHHLKITAAEINRAFCLSLIICFLLGWGGFAPVSMVRAEQAEPPGSSSGDSNISIDQAVSDEAQLNTLSFDGLAFLTGDMCSSTFYPPGKVSDFFGFQYLRDVTPNGFGHNTEFAGRVSDSVLSILTNAQVQALVTLANNQAEQVDAYAYKRFVLIKAFQRLLNGDVPAGASGLDKDAVMSFAADLYAIDGQISYDRARTYGGIISALTDSQKAQLADLRDAFTTLFQNAGEGGTIANSDWPAATPVDLSGLQGTNRGVLVSTYADDIFSWYFGSVDGDTYFCPERHGTYFGSFYMKDIPPMTAAEGVTIDTNLTADMGTAFLNALNASQKAMITDLVTTQKTDLNNIVSTREAISEKFRQFMTGASVSQDEVLALARSYGSCDGELSYHYATSFTDVHNTLTTDQADTLMGLRLEYYQRFPEYQADSHAYDCQGAWLYSDKIAMPEIQNTDFLFNGSGSTGSQAFKLTSSVGTDGGTLPVDYTYDGSGVSPDLSWTNVPLGTKEFALLMSTLPGDGSILYNWVLYGIPAGVTNLAKNTSGVGLSGISSHEAAGYAPPQSQGPGEKLYTFTLYALSGSPDLPGDPAEITGDVLAGAIASLTLGSASLNLNYSRTAPVADFSSAADGLTVTFQNASGLSAASWEWAFGDGVTSTEQNPRHTYSVPGDYTVALTVENSFGANTTAKDISVDTEGTDTTPSKFGGGGGGGCFIDTAVSRL
ncbi:MAG: PKD domain-containing protein [Thermodesulfobacteriota bacterium]